MKRKKILVKGAVGNYNFGDDLLTFSISSFLSELNTAHEVNVLSHSAYLKKHIEKVKLVSPDNVRGKFDILLYAGGTQFASFKKKKSLSKIPPLQRIFFFLHRPDVVYRRIQEKFFKKSGFTYESLAMVGVGIGPFIDSDNYYRTCLNLFKRTNFLAVRDEKSKDFCIEQNLAYVDGADLVFSLPDKYWQNFRITSGNNVESIAIIIRDWDYSSRNEQFVHQLIKLKKTNYKISFFSFCKKKDKKGIKLLHENGFSVNVWNPKIMAFNDYLSDLAKHDMFITARYHGAVVASLLKKPFISIGLEQKLTQIASLFSMPVWNFPYDMENCHSLIKGLDEEYSMILKPYQNALKKEIKKSQNMMNELKQFIEGSSSNEINTK